MEIRFGNTVIVSEDENLDLSFKLEDGTVKSLQELLEDEK